MPAIRDGHPAGIAARCPDRLSCRSVRRRADAGFTLLELLVAVAIFTVVAAMAYGGLRVVLDAQATTAERAARLARLQQALAAVERDLHSVVDRPVRDGYGDPLPAFQGGGGVGVAFTRLAWGGAAAFGGRVQRVEYVRSGDILERGLWPVPDRAPDTTAQRMRLLGGVREVRWRFLTGDGLWQAYWPPAGEGAAVPDAVEVVVELEDWGEIRRLLPLPGG